MKYLYAVSVFLGILLFGCNKSENFVVHEKVSFAASLKDYEFYTYSEYRPPFTIPSSNNAANGVLNNTLSVSPLMQNPNNPFPVDPVVNLGRVLFYDKNLSLNGQVSCGSCHIQSKAFTDGLDFSRGFNNGVTTRSAMSVQNMAFINNYTWLSSTNSLVDLVMKPLTHPVEMGNNTVEEVAARIKKIDYYEKLFKVAYGNAEIDVKSMTWALAQFVGSIYSSKSKFDVSILTALSNLSQEERQGKELFFGKAMCNTCHAYPTFAAPDFVGGAYGSNGVLIADLKSTFANDKKGMANNGLPGLSGDLSKLKIPTLRNIEVTGPYMHDGRFKTLEDVIEHYDHDVLASTDLDETLRAKDRSAMRLHLTPDEKKALKAFLLTLTDTELLTAKRYSDPF